MHVEFRSMEKYVYDYRIDASEIHEENKGVIVAVRETFGFLANASHPKGIYFNASNIASDLGVGDKVTFEIYTNDKGLAAKNIKKDE